MAGWIKLHRAIKYSDIYVMPPLYLRVFERLLIEANHKDNEIPFKHFGSDIITKKLIRRGERLTSIRTISEWVGWYERGIFKKPNTKTIKTILDWLVANDMIEIYPNESNREGTHYRVVNYNDYQSGDSEEVTKRKQSGNSQETVTGSKQECIKNDKESICMYTEKLKEIVSLFENNIGVIPPILIDEISDYSKTFNEDMFSEAIKIASNNKKRTVNYVLGILRQWKDGNIFTINDLEALRKEKQIEREKDTNKKKTQAKKTRFHNFDQRSDKYSEEDLEKVVERKRKEAKERMKE